MQARVATFEGGDADQIRSSMAEIGQRSESGPPEGVPAKALLVLHQADQGKVMAITLFETPEDYETGHATLESMDPPTPGAMGRRTSVERWEVGADRRV
jgi:hypothetical protein